MPKSILSCAVDSLAAFMPPATKPSGDSHGRYCVLSWNRDPATGVIFIQSGTPSRWVHALASSGLSEAAQLECWFCGGRSPRYAGRTFSLGKPIKEICRELHCIAQGVVRKGHSLETPPSSITERSRQPLPRIGPWRQRLESLLEENESKAARERLTLVRLYEELRGLGFEGSYAAVRRYAIAWREKRVSATADAFVPLTFAPGEAYQFDWSHEIVVMDGVTTIVKVAHLGLCHKSIRNLSAVTRVGLDLAKRVFQVHAVEAKGEIVVARKLTRSQLIPFFAELPPCVVAREACSSGHHWGRALIELGHEVRLISARSCEALHARRNKEATRLTQRRSTRRWVGSGQRFVHQCVRSTTRAELMRPSSAPSCLPASARRCSMLCAAIWPRSASSRRRARAMPMA